MTILRSEIRNKYSQVPNSIIRCKDLSDGDFRLLLYLYSLPDKWRINQSHLAAEMNCNLRNISSKLKRIKEAGYLEITRAKKEEDSEFIYYLKEKDTSSSDMSSSDMSSSDMSVNDVYINTDKINTEIINTNIKSRETFKKPTLEEISSYCLERNNGINAEAFYDFYESKNWMIGKNKMKDWKACVRTWEKRSTPSKSKRELQEERFKKIEEEFLKGE